MRGATGNPAGGHHDVVIVGAGLAGLNAARQLRRTGHDVLVLEARSEVGGRTLPSGESIRRLPPASTWRDFARVAARAAMLSRGIKQDRPWDAPRARELDGIATAEWLAEFELAPDTSHILDRLLGSLSTGGLERLSLLQLLWWMRHAGGPVRSLLATFQSRIAEGAQELSRRISRDLGHAVRVDSPVRRIHQGEGVTVETTNGETHEARRAIVAVPVPLVERIALDPPLPRQQQRLADLRIGAGTKVIAVLPPDHDVRANTVLGGDVLWGGWRRGNRITGIAPPPGSQLPEGALTADLARAFGVTRSDLRSPTVFRWGDEEHIAGCDAAFAPGEVCEFGPVLAQAHGRIHFAGAERSSWPDNMEGALESGERAASEAMGAPRVTKGPVAA